MPSRPKRKAAQQESAPMRKALRRPSSTKAAAAAPAAKEASKPELLFNKYRAEDDVIGPEGVEAFCRDLQLDPSDVKVLILAWKMGAKRMGYFSREEFLYGLQRLNAFTPDAIRRALEQAEASLQGSSQFQDFYVFAFRYCLTEPAQKIIDKDTAATMLGITMGHAPHTQPFVEFLNEQTEYKTINMDQWTGFYRFSQEVSPDCGNFDEAQAWPLLLDNYVEWRQGSS